MPERVFGDAVALIQAMDARRISSEELLDFALKRRSQVDDRLRAVVCDDEARARTDARHLDQRRAAGETSATLGLLAGVPMTVKDTFDVDGMPASAGLKALLGRASADAAAVGRARAEGAVIWGKTNVPVMAADWQSFNDLYGATCNPFDLERTPGGSSGGAAAAVAAGIAALEIGSDIAGSLRVPASFCGIFAHKPTYGLAPQRGHVPPAPGAAAERDLNVVGPMARSARDLRLLLSVIGYGPLPARAPPATLSGLKVAAWLDEPGFWLDDPSRQAIEGLLKGMEGAGAHVQRVKGPVSGEDLTEVFRDLLLPLIAEDMPEGQRRRLRALGGPARLLGGAAPWARTARAASLTHHEWLKANERRAQHIRTLRDFFSRFDVLVAPAAPTAAFPHDHRPFAKRRLALADGRQIPYESMLSWIALATVCGLPATAAPAGVQASGLPVGVQIIGPRGGDSRTLAVAEAIEAEIVGFRAPTL